MFDKTPNPGLFDKYLRLLGVTTKPPGYDALAELVSAHMLKIPFESVSKLFYKKSLKLFGPPDLAQYLEGIEKYHFGGTCYSNNFYLHLLLVHLGYDCRLCGADMSNPDVHIVSFVMLDGREYLLDVGYAAPFLTPLPRDLKEDYIVELGKDRYLLRPQDENGRSRMDLFRNGQLTHGYLAKPQPRQIDYFAGPIQHSFRPTATFMNALLIVRFFRDRSLVLHNLTVIESYGTDTRVRQLKDRAELPHTVEELFGIPGAIVAEAIGEIGEFGDAWS
jgi:N-hydroxyarylamine O-acetyltransferase